jgi:hypothetical protein
MRIQHVAQAAMGWPDASAAKAGTSLAERIERIRWRLWHGQVRRGLDLIAETVAMLEATAGTASSARSAVLGVTPLLGELETCVCGQSDIIIDYASARRREEPISTAVTESAVQWLVHRRMNARQQMRWTPRGAHLMLKVRCAVMNGTLQHDHALAEAAPVVPFAPRLDPPGLRRSLLRALRRCPGTWCHSDRGDRGGERHGAAAERWREGRGTRRVIVRSGKGLATIPAGLQPDRKLPRRIIPSTRNTGTSTRVHAAPTGSSPASRSIPSLQRRPCGRTNLWLPARWGGLRSCWQTMFARGNPL